MSITVSLTSIALLFLHKCKVKTKLFTSNICRCHPLLRNVQNGVRGLMLDVYEFNGDIWLCHSDGICYDFTAFVSLTKAVSLPRLSVRSCSLRLGKVLMD